MFSSLAQPATLDGSNHLSSTTVIHNLMDSDAIAKNEQLQVDNIEKKEKNRRRKKKPGLNLEDLSPSKIVELDKKEVDHKPPTAKSETMNQPDGGWICWICTTKTTTGGPRHSGRGNSAATYRFPLIVKAIHRLDKTRPGEVQMSHICQHN